MVSGLEVLLYIRVLLGVEPKDNGSSNHHSTQSSIYTYMYGVQCIHQQLYIPSCSTRNFRLLLRIYTYLLGFPPRRVLGTSPPCPHRSPPTTHHRPPLSRLLDHLSQTAAEKAEKEQASNTITISDLIRRYVYSNTVTISDLIK